MKKNEIKIELKKYFLVLVCIKNLAHKADRKKAIGTNVNSALKKRNIKKEVKFVTIINTTLFEVVFLSRKKTQKNVSIVTINKTKLSLKCKLSNNQNNPHNENKCISRLILL